MNKVKAIAVSLVFFAVTACGGGGDVSVVKKGKLQSCPDFTVEEMFDTYLEKPKWKGTSEKGIDYVNVSGITAGRGEPQNVFMQFWVRNDNFGVQALEINENAKDNTYAYLVLDGMCTRLKLKAKAEHVKKAEERASKGAIQAEPIKDTRDGKTYKTVKIGEQVWMAENLNIETGNSVCYDNDPANCKKYGRLYDWETAMKACPKGWHLLSREEWNKLLDYVNGIIGTKSYYDENMAGKYLKAKSGNGTDNYGFSALPGGYGDSDGSFNDVGYGGYWWSSSEFEISDMGTYAHSIEMSISSDYTTGDGQHIYKSGLQSVRCLQD